MIMIRFRRTISIFVALGMLAFGGAACTPEQQAGASAAAGPLWELVLFAFFASLSPCPPTATPSCPPFG